MPQEKTTKEKLLEKIHIKWLSKAKTAIINGDEMTVLPYGYLTQACSEAIDQTREEIIMDVEAEMKNIYNDEEGRGNWEYTIGYKERNNEVLDILNKLKK